MITISDPLECLYLACSTVCNLRCHFCAYRCSTLPKSHMPFTTFTAVVEQATAYGFETFNLTPLIGEPLADPGFLDKLAYLEQHPGVYDFYFCTNLTLADVHFFDTVARLKKLRCLSISIYGHDQASFTALTEASPGVYRHLLQSLERLGAYTDLLKRTELRLRTSPSFDLDTCESEVCDSIRQLSGARVRTPRHYQNWGGLIDPPRLPLDITLKLSDEVKTEPCVFLFFKPTILPNGDLNACSAGDGNAALTIGNVLEQGFDQIYSSDNERYMKLLDAHQRRQFDGPCQACTGYRSLSADWYSYQYHRKPRITLDEFYQRLAKK